MKKTITLLFICFILNSYSQKSQFLDYKTLAKNGTMNYFEIVNLKQKELKSLDLTILKNLKESKHFYRWATFWKDRVDKNGNFPPENLGFYNAGILDQKGKVKQSNLQLKSNENWTNVGPQGLPDKNDYPNYPQMGRLNCLLRIKHPSDRNLDVLFVGAPNGGVWKSTDGGATWSPKLDMVAGIGVTDIKTTPDATFANYTSKPIYVSTGDYDATHVNSIGVLKSTDGGETFSSTGLSYTVNQQSILGQLIVHNDDIVLVGSPTGIKVTTDGGTNWSDSYNAGLTNANFGRVALNGTKAMYTGTFDVIYTDDYTQGNWTSVISNNNEDKHAVTVGEDGIFYVQDSNGQIKQFDDSNNTFSDYGSIPPSYDSQGGYNMALIVKNNLILSGEVSGTTSTDNGSNWYNALNGYWENNSSDGNYVHSDHHGMGTLDGTYEFWSVNDGGLDFIDFGPNPTNQKPTITYKSEKVIVTQSYSVAINPTANDDSYVISNQDNDSFSKINGTWYAVAMGDGIQSAIDYNNPATRYTGNQSGNIIQSTTGFQGEYQGNGKSVSIPGAHFYYPLEINKTNPNILYGGGDEIYKIENGANLTITSLNSGAGVASQQGAIIDIATHGNSILVYGTNGLRFSDDGGSNWSTLTGNPGTINSVDFDANDNSVIYVTVSGYTDGSKVFISTDSGANFTNISGDLPNIVMKEVMLKQNQSEEYLFVATELGVYFSINGGTNWNRLGNGLPMVDVRDIEIHYTNDKLVAATFGRGLWEISIANSSLGTSINNISEKITAFPNPSSNYINIDVKSANKLNYIIYNVVGGVVKKGELETNQIDISQLAKQTYILKLTDGIKNYTTKIVKY